MRNQWHLLSWMKAMSVQKAGYEEVIAKNYPKLIWPRRKHANKLVIDGMEVIRLGDFGVSVRVRELNLAYPHWSVIGFLQQYVRNLNFVRNHFRLRWKIATQRLTEGDFMELTQRLVLERMNVLAPIQRKVILDEENLRDGHVRSILFVFLSSKFGLNNPLVRTVASRLLGCDQVRFQRTTARLRKPRSGRSPDTVRSRI